jgi:hypothetical protein
VSWCVAETKIYNICEQVISRWGMQLKEMVWTWEPNITHDHAEWFIYIYIYIHINVIIYIYIAWYKYIYIYIFVYIYIYICICRCVYVCVSIDMYMIWYMGLYSLTWHVIGIYYIGVMKIVWMRHIWWQMREEIVGTCGSGSQLTFIFCQAAETTIKKHAQV